MTGRGGPVFRPVLSMPRQGPPIRRGIPPGSIQTGAIMAEQTKTTKKKSTTKKAENVPVKWIHSKGDPGETRLFYGVKCVANDDGLFIGELTPERAEREFNRENIYRFEPV